MRRDVVFVLVWALVLAAMVHVDWHVGRPAEWRLSLGWPLHWSLGSIVGVGMGWSFLRRRSERNAWAMLAVAGGLGLVLGQIVQPASEALLRGLSLAEVYPSVRWQLFAAFALAWVGGTTAAAAATRLRRPAHPA